MAGDIAGISSTALLAFQRALATTSHNISNVHTDGYSRQRTEFISSLPQLSGSSYIGTGVQIKGTERLFNNYILTQINVAQSSHARFERLASMSLQLDRVLSDPATGLSSTIQGFFDSVNDVASDPDSISARNIMLQQSELLSGRFKSLDSQINQIDKQINNEVSFLVTEINDLAKSVAALNSQISIAESSNATANDLLDRRDQIIKELAGLVSISTVAEKNGIINVFIGNGQALVTGISQEKLVAIKSDFNPLITEVGLQAGTSSINITPIIKGGSLGGVLDFRNQVLDVANNNLGKIARGLTQTFNLAHKNGMDLNGNLGKNYFTEPPLTATNNSFNNGNAVISGNISDVNSLMASDYHLRYEGGSNWNITRLSDNLSWPTTTPITFDGMDISVSGTPAVGDRFLVQPTRNLAGKFDNAINSPYEIAAAFPIYANENINNSGNAQVDLGKVVDGSNPDLLLPTDIVFLDSSTYQINGAGPIITYSSGTDIELNGWRINVKGQPSSGDIFTVSVLASGNGDNRNALTLTGLQSEQLLSNSTQTYQSSYSTLLADIGEKTRSSEINLDAMGTILEQAEAARESVSGVNLDEEAANLIRFEQAYQAAAKVISIADDLFNSLLLAIRR